MDRLLPAFPRDEASREGLGSLDVSVFHPTNGDGLVNVSRRNGPSRATDQNGDRCFFLVGWPENENFV